MLRYSNIEKGGILVMSFDVLDVCDEYTSPKIECLDRVDENVCVPQKGLRSYFVSSCVR